MLFQLCLVNLAPFFNSPSTITFDKPVSRCFQVGFLRPLAKRSFMIAGFGLLQQLPLIFLGSFHILSSSDSKMRSAILKLPYELTDNTIQFSHPCVNSHL